MNNADSIYGGGNYSRDGHWESMVRYVHTHILSKNIITQPIIFDIHMGITYMGTIHTGLTHMSYIHGIHGFIIFYTIFITTSKK